MPLGSIIHKLPLHSFGLKEWRDPGGAIFEPVIFDVDYVQEQRSYILFLLHFASLEA